MRLLLSLLVVVVGFLSWQLGLLQAVFGFGFPPETPATLEDRIASDLLTSRQLKGMPPLTADHELQGWLLTAPQARSGDPDTISRIVRQTWPQYQDVRVLRTYSLFEDEVLERINEWAEDGGGELSHLSVALKPGWGGIGTGVTVVAGTRLPVLSAEALADAQQSRFYTTCLLCRKGQPCQISREARMFQLRCQHCLKVYGSMAADTQGKYHAVNEFLTGYMPPNSILPGASKVAELMAIWQASTQMCRYLTDGRQDDAEAWQFPEETATLRQGDCEDSALLLTDWLLAREFQARVVIGAYETKRTAHAWVVVRLEGNDFLLESTEVPFGLQRPPLVRELGARYVPELLFDRHAIYAPRNPTGAPRGDYWGEAAWERVTQTAAEADPAGVGGG
jgi:hypothetical protein